MQRRAFDLIGTIAVIGAETQQEEEALVKKITATYPRVTVVLKKTGSVKGTYRRRGYRIVFRDAKGVKEHGLGTTETIHTESGCRFMLDVRRVFFNPREVTIRQHIANQVKPGERVLVMFSGVAPYPILIAKTVRCYVAAVEMNATAAMYAMENVRINHVQERVELFHENVRHFKPKERFDRIVMPLGITAYRYLNTAMKLVKSGGIVHLYGSGDKSQVYEELEKNIRKTASAHGKKIQVMEERFIANYSPGVHKVCVTFRVR